MRSLKTLVQKGSLCDLLFQPPLIPTLAFATFECTERYGLVNTTASFAQMLRLCIIYYTQEDTRSMGDRRLSYNPGGLLGEPLRS